jgi:hypothetical protein
MDKCSIRLVFGKFLKANGDKNFSQGAERCEVHMIVHNASKDKCPKL